LTDNEFTGIVSNWIAQWIADPARAIGADVKGFTDETLLFAVDVAGFNGIRH
jgi:hypothetical protein